MANNKRLFKILKGILTRIQPIKRGGTGATTAAGARTNLGIDYYMAWDVASEDNIAIAPKGYKSGTISCPKSDYELIGVTGFVIGLAGTGGTLSTYCYPIIIRPNNSANTVYYELKNTAENTTARVKLTVYLLYRKL